MADNFTKWMLGISAAVIVAMGGALFSTVVALREDMAVIKNELGSMKETVTKLDVLQSQVADHEYRIQWIERAGDNTGADGTARATDTVRRKVR